jgi:hypothetical protein
VPQKDAETIFGKGSFEDLVELSVDNILKKQPPKEAAKKRLSNKSTFFNVIRMIYKPYLLFH